MRTTQIIGLTKSAEDFVSELKQIESDTHETGMFSEKIPLRRWEYNKGCVRERLQACPWSSGPMLFYCLEYDFGNGGKEDILQWVCDPRVENEYDTERGVFWV